MNLTQGFWWVCIFMIPMWIAWSNLWISKIELILFLAGYSAVILQFAKLYLQFHLFGGFVFEWIFAFSGCSLAFFVARKISR